MPSQAAYLIEIDTSSCGLLRLARGSRTALSKESIRNPRESRGQIALSNTCVNKRNSLSMYRNRSKRFKEN